MFLRARRVAAFLREAAEAEGGTTVTATIATTTPRNTRPSLNKVILMGTVGKDPKTFGRAEAVKVSFPLATSHDFRDKSGEMVSKTEWHTISTFNQKLNDYLLKFVKKGALVYVEGSISNTKYVDLNGVSKSFYEIICAFPNQFKVIKKPFQTGTEAGGSEPPTGQAPPREREDFPT